MYAIRSYYALFLPEGVNFDKLLRALIGIALFQASYNFV